MATNVESHPDVSMTSLVSGIVNDAQELMKQQFQLLKVEVQEDVRKTSEAAMSLAIGLTVALVGAIVLCHAAAWGLNYAFPSVHLWVWYAVVGGVVAGIGAILTLQAIAKFRSFNPLPDQTTKALEENLEWKTKPR